jgi:hypothetical protein
MPPTTESVNYLTIDQVAAYREARCIVNYFSRRAWESARSSNPAGFERILHAAQQYHPVLESIFFLPNTMTVPKWSLRHLIFDQASKACLDLVGNVFMLIRRLQSLPDTQQLWTELYEDLYSMMQNPERQQDNPERQQDSLHHSIQNARERLNETGDPFEVGDISQMRQQIGRIELWLLPFRKRLDSIERKISELFKETSLKIQMSVEGLEEDFLDMQQGPSVDPRSARQAMDLSLMSH